MRYRDHLPARILDIDDYAIITGIRRREFDRVIRRVCFRALLLVPPIFVDVVVIGVRLRFRNLAALRRYRPRDLAADLYRFRIRRYRRRKFRLFRLTYGDIITVCIHRTRSGAFYICGDSILTDFSRRIGECILRSILRRLGHQIPCILIYVEIIRIISGAAGGIRLPRNRLAEFNIRRFGRHRDRERLCIFIGDYVVLRIFLHIPKGSKRHIAEAFFVPQIVFYFGDTVFNITFDDTNCSIIARQEHCNMLFAVRAAQEYQIALLRLIILVRQLASQRAAHIAGGGCSWELWKVRAIGAIADEKRVPIRPCASIPIAVMRISLQITIGKDKVAGALVIANLSLYDLNEVSTSIFGKPEAFRFPSPRILRFRRAIRNQCAATGRRRRSLRIGNRYSICIFAILFRRIGKLQRSSFACRFIHGHRFFMRQIRPKSNFVLDIVRRGSALDAVLHMPCALAHHGIIRSAGFNRQRKCFLFAFVGFICRNRFIRQISIRFTGRIGRIGLIPIFLFAVFTLGFFLRRLLFFFRFFRGVLFRFGRNFFRGGFFHNRFFRRRFFLYRRNFRFRFRLRFLYNVFHLYLFRKRIRKNRRENVHTANSKRQRHQQRCKPSEMFSVKSHAFSS